MKKSLFALLLSMLVDFANANSCEDGTPTANLTCTGANNTGQCFISGYGNCSVSSINAETLTVRNISGVVNVLTIRVAEVSSNSIKKLIIDSGGTSGGSTTRFQIMPDSGPSGSRAKISVGSVEKGNNAGDNPSSVYLGGVASLTNQDGTDNIQVQVRGVGIIQKPGRGNTSSGGGNTGGNVNIPPEATPYTNPKRSLWIRHSLKRTNR